MKANPIITKNQVNNFGLSKAVYPPYLKQPPHLHESASLSFMISGSLSENYEGKNRSYQSFTLLVHSPQKVHSVEFYHHPVEILNVQMDSEFSGRFSSLAKILDNSTACRSENIACLGNRLAREFSQIDELSALVIEGIVLELLVEVSRQTSNKNAEKTTPWLNRAKDFLHDNFSESVGLEEVANAVGIHPVHLARVFRRQFGCTMGEYVRLLRLEFAKRELSVSNKPLCEIALSAGFSDQSHLNKSFKNIFGLTPKEYRRTSRQS